MFRLYLRFYVALLVSLVLFVLATATLWHFTSGPSEQAGMRMGRLVQNILPPASAPDIRVVRIVMRAGDMPP